MSITESATGSEPYEAFLSAELPDSFSFADRSSLTPPEIVSLREAAGWYGNTPGGWQHLIENSLILVGVRDVQKTLVGMGRVTGDCRHAVLCDFVVHPDYRGRRIGQAILLERMKLAKDLGIIYMYAELQGHESAATSIY